MPGEQRDREKSRMRAADFAETARRDVDRARRAAVGDEPMRHALGSFIKHDSDKPRPELIPPGFVMLLGEVFAYGAKKYSEDNWRKCPDARRYVGAALRHVYAFADGETLDQESGLHHLGHAAASIAMLWGLAKESK